MPSSHDPAPHRSPYPAPASPQVTANLGGRGVEQWAAVEQCHEIGYEGDYDKPYQRRDPTEEQKAQYDAEMAVYIPNQERLDDAKRSGGPGMLAFPDVEGMSDEKVDTTGGTGGMTRSRGASPRGLAEHVMAKLEADVDAAAAASLGALCQCLGDWRAVVGDQRKQRALAGHRASWERYAGQKPGAVYRPPQEDDDEALDYDREPVRPWEYEGQYHSSGMGMGMGCVVS